MMMNDTKNPLRFQCKVCKGFLHEWWECPTRWKLDKFAKKNGDAANWGNWKYFEYYKDWFERLGDDDAER